MNHLQLRQRAFGVFTNREDLEGAIAELADAEFPMAQISTINRESTTHSPVTETRTQDGLTTGAIAGGAVGGMAGLLLGLGTLAAIPGVGGVVLIGAAATALATTLTGGTIGATTGGLLGALIGYGIPNENATIYERSIQQGEYFIMIDGTEAEIRQAEAILSRWRVRELRIYNLG